MWLIGLVNLGLMTYPKEALSNEERKEKIVGRDRIQRAVTNYWLCSSYIFHFRIQHSFILYIQTKVVENKLTLKTSILNKEEIWLPFALCSKKLPRICIPLCYC